MLTVYTKQYFKFHRACKDVEYIPKLAELAKFNTTEEYNTCIANAEYIQKENEPKKKSLDDEENYLQTVESEIIGEIKQYTQHLTAKLKELESKSIGIVKQRRTTISKQMQDDSSPRDSRGGSNRKARSSRVQDMRRNSWIPSSCAGLGENNNDQTGIDCTKESRDNF